jgi:glycosyltransferase involved in cell wall biosynthesis
MTAPSAASTTAISVVVPCYNAERWITATLRSVLAQDGPPLDIVVVDDGSVDNSAALVQQQFPQVRLLRQPNRGVAAARNLGIEHSRGEWVAFIDADDIWLPGKLRAQCDALAAQPETQLSCTAWQVWDSDEPEPMPQLLATLAEAAADTQRWAGPSGWIYPQLLLSSQVWTSTVLARRELLAQLGGFDTSLRIGEDLDLWLRASRTTPILRVAQPLALYRMHPASITKGAPQDNYQARVIESALARWGYAAPDGTQASKRDVNRALARTWRDFGGAHLDAGNLLHARHGALMTLKHDWREPAHWKLLAKSWLRSAAGAGK